MDLGLSLVADGQGISDFGRLLGRRGLHRGLLAKLLLVLDSEGGLRILV